MSIINKKISTKEIIGVLLGILVDILLWIYTILASKVFLILVIYIL